MAQAKTEEFTAKQNKAATMLKALGHPARIAIVEYLIKCDSCVCGDIVDRLPLAQATVSQHLKALKEAGIIQGTVEGTSVCYCMDEKAIHFLKAYFISLADQVEGHKPDRCGVPAIKPKIKLSEIQSQTSCCTPGSGCC